MTYDPTTRYVNTYRWTDIYHSLRNSPRATAEVNWHVKRLRNIHLHRKALYPPARVPRQEVKTGPDGVDYGFDAPNLLNLKKHHFHINASVVLKAAMALVNVSRTKHTHCLLNNYEACRSNLPFWPDTFRYIPTTNGSTVADLDAADVAGPTFNAVTNLIPVEHSESGLAFLNRLQAEQLELTKYAHAPWRRIMAALDELHPGEHAGEMIPETHSTYLLTWTPGGLGEYERIRIANAVNRCALGMIFIAALGGEQATMYGISIRYDAANFSAEEGLVFVKDVEKAVLWLLEEENWDRPIGEFLGQLRGGSSGLSHVFVGH